LSGRGDLEAFGRRLGHDFSEPGLLARALTHSSAAAEGPGRRDAARSNERLEFLGDRVLALVMAEALLAEDPGAPEGRIAPRFNALVRRETCADVARQLGLGAMLRLGRSEARSGGRRKEALLADAMEAVIAAIYRDGGFEAARRAVTRLWGDRIHRVEDDARDAKTALQEWAQARGEEPPDYVEVGREGPDHAPVFTMEARLEGGRSAKARAGSKREAEQSAAAALLASVTEGEAVQGG
jgi:ribonuclease-3